MGNKARASKQALKVRHAGHDLRSTQNACIKQENLKPRSESSLSMTKGEKLQVTKHSSHEAATKDHSLIFQRESTNRYPDSENPNVVKKNKQKPQNPRASAEDLSGSVCLTQEQLQQILVTVKEGTRRNRSISETQNEKQEEAGKILMVERVSFLGTEQSVKALLGVHNLSQAAEMVLRCLMVSDKILFAVTDVKLPVTVRNQMSDNFNSKN